MATNDGRIDSLLNDIEKGSYPVGKLTKEIEQEQLGILQYVLDEENNFLTDAEQNQLVFILTILWNLRRTKSIVSVDELLDLEDRIWEASDKGNFPYDIDIQEVDKVPDDIFAILLDAVEYDHLTPIGSNWLMVKGLVLASVLKSS